MKINTIKIKNFRGIPDMEISLERISFFTGPCGAGKTSVLKAFNFALTGDVKKDDIREQSDRASATIVFEDQSSIQRICKLSAATQVKVNPERELCILLPQMLASIMHSQMLH